MTHARAHISIGDVRYTTLNVYDIYILQGGLCVRRVFPPVGLRTVQIYPLGHPSVGERASECFHLPLEECTRYTHGISYRSECACADIPPCNSAHCIYVMYLTGGGLCLETLTAGEAAAGAEHRLAGIAG
jgi:hypothetical protein